MSGGHMFQIRKGRPQGRSRCHFDSGFLFRKLSRSRRYGLLQELFGACLMCRAPDLFAQKNIVFASVAARCLKRVRSHGPAWLTMDFSSGRLVLSRMRAAIKRAVLLLQKPSFSFDLFELTVFLVH
jgi:hypothetical protein